MSLQPLTMEYDDDGAPTDVAAGKGERFEPVPASDAPVSGTREKVAEGEERRARLGSMRELAEWDRERLSYRFVKRAFDIVFSACVIAVAIVPSAVLCAAIAIESPGCPLYRQRRVGRIGADGRPREFTMWKFRSMVKDADKMKDALMAENEVEGPMFKMRDDPRVTRIGRFIRKHSIDEFPQFLNVLLGDIPLRILKTRPEFSEESMGAFALPAKSSTNRGKAFSQVVSCFVNGLRMRRISLLNCNCIGGMETQFLAKPVFGVSPVHPGTLFQKSNNGLAKAAW